MRIIATIDDRNGMMFNHRRQSQDQVLRKRVIELCKGSELWLNDYSYRQFTQTTQSEQSGAIQFHVTDHFLEEAPEGAYCFVEDQPISAYEDRLEELVLFRWNRKYPGDFFLDYLPDEHGMKCIQTEEFKGNSHDKITMEVWRKEI